MAAGKSGASGTIGGRIAQARFSLAARLGRNVTQAWLADQCKVSGPTVSQWEAGVTEPTIDSVAKIAKALGVSPGWLAFGEVSVDELTNPLTARKLTEGELDRADEAARKKRRGRNGVPRRKAQ